MDTRDYDIVSSHVDAVKALKTLTTHLVDYGKIELGSPQSKLLISVRRWLEREDNPLRLPAGVDSRQ